ncbi:hypothetical protein Rsub_02711 [Raphidocelis subcapitata]|uniref:Uncharacterized protein n=1 Tax=Raphidocelis subcapitata TaxID=307507 RepID=A0A2V0NYW4_9CHLO|nr:hypothetical protein Rsub_02711 [Raphidocelis subcapitata]|eukprot:GBF90005.1 hypothetical protein Rsub_02711 [Raphidocelis subcapitata]
MISHGSAATRGSRAAAHQRQHVALRAPVRQASVRGRPRTLVVSYSTKAAELLARAHERYSSKDLMAAMKLYEDVVNEDGATTRQKQAALYGSTAVHASFGDIELAQITLREGLKYGLDFEQALADPDLPDLMTSPQMLIQLRRFNTTAQSAITSRAGARQQQIQAAALQRAARVAGGGLGLGSGLPLGGGSPLGDLGSILGTPSSSSTEIDTSLMGVLRRVLGLVVVLTLLGVGLFYLGLEYVLKVPEL